MDTLSYYKKAQICLNGHLINLNTEDHPNKNLRHCELCGAETVTECSGCKTAIHGAYVRNGMIKINEYVVPKYCYSCGATLPWTKIALEAARELIETFEELSSSEKDELNESVGQLIAETPRSKLAANKFKRLLSKAGMQAAGEMRSLLIDIVSETVKKTIFPS